MFFEDVITSGVIMSIILSWPRLKFVKL